jgi:hypothetical protein
VQVIRHGIRKRLRISGGSVGRQSKSHFQNGCSRCKPRDRCPIAIRPACQTSRRDGRRIDQPTHISCQAPSLTYPKTRAPEMSAPARVRRKACDRCNCLR